MCVGRLCRQKGQDILLDAWPAVLERVPDAHLLLVGDGPDAGAVRRRAGNGIRLAGKRTDVPIWLAAADVVAVPSRYDGMSVALLEAMASGRASSRATWPVRALGDAGVLVRPESPSGLAEALADLLLDPARARSSVRRPDSASSASTISALRPRRSPTSTPSYWGSPTSSSREPTTP